MDRDLFIHAQIADLERKIDGIIQTLKEMLKGGESK